MSLFAVSVSRIFIVLAMVAQIRRILALSQFHRLLTPPSTSLNRRFFFKASSLLAAPYHLELEAASPLDMEEVGAVISLATVPGDVILLGGDLGAGKTCFSRGFVREKTGIPDLSVTSPTYLLSNTYPTLGPTIHHMDLYRLSGTTGDLEPLDLDNVFNNCISLIEWPSRLGHFLPPDRLEVIITIEPGLDTSNFKPLNEDDSPTNIDKNDEDIINSSRILKLSPHGDRWLERLVELENGGLLDDMILEIDEILP